MGKKFAWCVQSAAGYPHLDAMRGDRSDAVGLTFRKPVPDSIYAPGTTHTTGRNRLLAEVAEEGYDYVIFADDDAVFDGCSMAEGFRRFEALLDEFNPAIASPRYQWHLKGHLDESARVQGLIATDICLNAIHHSVWRWLLPYWSAFDSLSWWNAAHVFNRVSAVLWPGGAVQFNELAVLNTKHTEYPRAGKCKAADAMLGEMLRPGMKHLVWPHDTPDSYRAVCPLLRNDYTLSAAEVSRYFDPGHKYWRGRL